MLSEPTTLNFDFSQVAVPFRMQPGLRRLAHDTPQLTPLAPGSRLHAEKRIVVRAGQSRHVAPGFDPEPALAAIARRLATDVGVVEQQAIPELACEQDLAVLDGATGTLPWLCVCVPSHWAPEEKVGLNFAALHSPVADNAALIAAATQLVKLVTAGDCWERFVWTLSPSDRYDQHPHRHPRTQWPQTKDAQEFAAACRLRVERQSFFPVERGTQQAVFAIRVMLQPLPQAVQSRADAQRLHDSLASMSQAVLDYKNLAAAREPLLRWLAAR